MRWFWMDRFTEFVSGSRATGIKCVSLSEDYLHDHWESYPVMPSSLMAEGMAQTSGLLVSETYAFQELVVLAKFAKCKFYGEVRPGDTLTYRAEIGRVNEDGAMVTTTAHVGEKLQAEAEIFFVRLGSDSTDGGSEAAQADGSTPKRLFDPAHLFHWLTLVGLFDVGIKQDGSRLRPEDYHL